MPAPSESLSPVVDPLSLSLLTLAGFVVLLALYLTQRQQLERLERVSAVEPLTGLVRGAYFDETRWPALHERTALRERAESALREAKRQGRGRALLDEAATGLRVLGDAHCVPEPVDDDGIRRYRTGEASGLPHANSGQR